MSVLSKPYFHDEAKAFEYLESILWADGIVCPHCGVIGGRVYKLEGKAPARPEKVLASAVSSSPSRSAPCSSMPASRCNKMAPGRLPDDEQQEGHQRRTSCTASSGSLTRRRGSWRIAFAKPCAPANLPRSAARAALLRSTRPSSADQGGVRQGQRRPAHKMAVLSLVAPRKRPPLVRGR